jgi:hypothetical protein
MSEQREDERMLALLAPLDTIEPVKRNGSRPSPRRLLLTLAVVLAGLAAAGAAIAAGLGAFSGNATTGDLRACKASAIAQTTPSGAQLLTGHTDAGIYCVAYKDANGAEAGTAGKFGETPVGQAVAMKVLDTSSNTYVIVAVVPPGYGTVSVGAVQVPIKNQVFVIDPKVAASPAEISGPAGIASIDLHELAGVQPAGS